MALLMVNLYPATTLAEEQVVEVVGTRIWSDSGSLFGGSRPPSGRVYSPAMPQPPDLGPTKSYYAEPKDRDVRCASKNYSNVTSYSSDDDRFAAANEVMRTLDGQSSGWVIFYRNIFAYISGKGWTIEVIYADGGNEKWLIDKSWGSYRLQSTAVSASLRYGSGGITESPNCKK